ncbi:MAG: hypothetical protein ABFS22_01700 [Pseudomonadota bacterium]
MPEFILDAVEARFGDCILIRWGDDLSKIMLIDGGPSSVYEDRLEPVIDEIRGELGVSADASLDLELAAVSHIDGDHVLGIEQLLKAIKDARNDQLAEKVRIKKFWLNNFDDILTGGGATPSAVLASLGTHAPPTLVGEVAAVLASVPQGRRTRDLARGLQLPGNMAAGQLVKSGDTLALPDDMDITVVAPASDELDALQDLWVNTPVADRATIAANIDPSIPNLSSIVMLLNRNGATALLTGDARGDLIRKALASAGLLDAEGKLHVNVLKLQHHGSKNNMIPEFFEKITADHYVISANGHHHHPSTDTLQAIVDARGNNAYAIHLTNDVPHATTLLNDAAAQLGRNFTVHIRATNDHKIRIAVG